jgi:hypothetical protein
MKTQLPGRYLIVGGAAAVGLLLASVLAPAHAGTITYVTPPKSMVSGLPVSAEAVFVTGQNSLTITLSNLLANPKDASQTMSDLSFTTNNAIGRSLSG